MKALEKDRARRYGTASDLAGDVRHYLNHELVVARPANISYQLRKYVRRHRVAVAVVTGLVIVLISFFVLQALQPRLDDTREPKRPGKSRAGSCKSHRRFYDQHVQGLRSEPVSRQQRHGQGNPHKASNEMDTGLAKDPEVQSQMTQVMAKTYENLGLYPRAHELAQRGLDSRLKLFGLDDAKVLELRAQLGYIVNSEGHYSDAEKMLRDALDGERRVLGDREPAHA